MHSATRHCPTQQVSPFITLSQGGHGQARRGQSVNHLLPNLLAGAILYRPLCSFEPRCIQGPGPTGWPASPACPSDRRKSDSHLPALASGWSTRPGKQLAPSAGHFPTQTLGGFERTEWKAGSLAISGEVRPGRTGCWWSNKSPGGAKTTHGGHHSPTSRSRYSLVSQEVSQTTFE